MPVFQFPRIVPLSEIGVGIPRIVEYQVTMKLREAGCEVVEDRSHALKEHELSETTTSLEASNE